MRIIKCAVEMLIFEYKRVIAMILLLALVLLLIKHFNDGTLEEYYKSKQN